MASLDDLPPHFEVFTLALLLGWERKRALSYFRALKVARKVGRRWGVWTHTLDSTAPEALEAIARRWRTRSAAGTAAGAPASAATSPPTTASTSTKRTPRASPTPPAKPAPATPRASPPTKPSKGRPKAATTSPTTSPGKAGPSTKSTPRATKPAASGGEGQGGGSATPAAKGAAPSPVARRSLVPGREMGNARRAPRLDPLNIPPVSWPHWGEVTAPVLDFLRARRGGRSRADVEAWGKAARVDSICLNQCLAWLEERGLARTLGEGGGLRWLATDGARAQLRAVEPVDVGADEGDVITSAPQLAG